ncbi:MAG: rhamnosyltransferase [Ruminococcaceae bacterium]|nr:rhamnosyltransferase [Oscillospiraceae bacterium]
MKIDVVCPLYCADDEIDGVIAGLKSQSNIQLHKVVFPITDDGDVSAVVQKIEKAGFDYFCVSLSDFSHSLTRQKAMMEYCESDVVLMMSQDVHFVDENAVFALVSAINEITVYAYGRQICKKKTIEKYTREKNYGKESHTVTAADVASMQLSAFFASDAFSAYHRPTFVALNGYDNSHMMMNEDMYYAKKIIDRGYSKAYVAQAVVEHSHSYGFKALYERYRATGHWFAEHPEFDNYKTTDSGMKLAKYVLKRALRDFNVPVLFRFLPDMTSRYLGMKKGKKG